MASFSLRSLTFTVLFKGYLFLDTQCNNCYIGSTLQPAPCPDCCCSQNVPNTKNCCYKASSNYKLDQSALTQTVPLYFLAALASLILVTIVMTCCFKLADQKCLYMWKRKRNPNRRPSCDSNGPPAYDNLAMEDVHVVVLKSPPYCKDPPSYTEVTCSPTDLPEVNDENG